MKREIMLSPCKCTACRGIFLDKEGIAVAQYWTVLPPKAEFERKIKEILEDAKERLNRRKLLTTSSDIKREIEYFYESKDDDDE